MTQSLLGFFYTKYNTPLHSSAAILNILRKAHVHVNVVEKVDAQRQKSCRNATFVMRKFSVSLPVSAMIANCAARQKFHNGENLKKRCVKRCL